MTCLCLGKKVLDTLEKWKDGKRRTDQSVVLVEGDVTLGPREEEGEAWR